MHNESAMPTTIVAAVGFGLLAPGDRIIFLTNESVDWADGQPAALL